MYQQPWDNGNELKITDQQYTSNHDYMLLLSKWHPHGRQRCQREILDLQRWAQCKRQYLKQDLRRLKGRFVASLIYASSPHSPKSGVPNLIDAWINCSCRGRCCRIATTRQQVAFAVLRVGWIASTEPCVSKDARATIEVGQYLPYICILHRAAWWKCVFNWTNLPSGFSVLQLVMFK